MKRIITLLLFFAFAFSLSSCDTQSSTIHTPSNSNVINNTKIEETTSATYWKDKVKGDVIPMMSSYMDDWYKQVGMYGDLPTITISNIQQSGANQWNISGTSTMNEKSGLTMVQDFSVVANYDSNQNSFSYSNIKLDDIKVYK
ncbi:MAG: hypothetical protein IIX44_01540 [Clostridia bacterium]|nr:hypothetical protein [Clostridia bacterium]